MPLPIITPPSVAVVAVVNGSAVIIISTWVPVVVAVIALPTKFSVVVAVLIAVPSSLTINGVPPPPVCPVDATYHLVPSQYMYSR